MHLRMTEELPTNSGRTSPDQPVIVPVPSTEDDDKQPHHSWTSSMNSLYELLSLSVFHLVIRDVKIVYF